MSRGIDDSTALDAFVKAHSYAAAEGLVIKNLSEHPVHIRAHRGNAGAYFSFEKLQTLEAHISELPAGAETKNHRHMCEALFYVLKGRGYSIMQEEGRPETRVEWQAGDLFFTPMLAWRKHINATP